MTRGQTDFQFPGFFGIFKEACYITSSYRKNFTQITLFLILPFSLWYLAKINTSKFFFEQIIHNKNVSESVRNSIISHILSSLDLPTILSLILSIFWTTAVVNTTLCNYTAEKTTYTKVKQVVSKVWKRLMITSMFNFVIYFALFIGALLAIILWPVTLAPSATGITVAIILLVYFLGVLYISFVCHLANVISVLEDVHGIEAIVKSKSLIKGNTGLCAAFFLIHNLCLLGIHLGFYKATAVGGDSFWDLMLLTFLWSMLMSMLMSMLILFGLVIQIIIYFNCKSYHGENIYVQVDSKDVEFKLFR